MMDGKILTNLRDLEMNRLVDRGQVAWPEPNDTNNKAETMPKLSFGFSCSSSHISSNAFVFGLYLFFSCLFFQSFPQVGERENARDRRM
jgi:hypothetical protein